jgi:hypothetical protein
MAHKKVLNPKDDFWEQKQTNRQRDFDALEMAKQQEAEMLVKKRLKTVRIDRSTIILIDAGVSEAEAIKRFRMNVNQ